MSLIPFLFDDFYGAPSYHWPMSTSFGGSSSTPFLRDLGDIQRSLNRLNRIAGGSHIDSGTRISNQSDKFEVSLDVKGFQPQELKVKVQDRMVTVHGKHEERQDEHGYISREFTRRYLVPEGIKMETVTSRISPNGVLTVSAPKHHAIEAPKEMEIEIQKLPAVNGSK